MCYTVCVAGSSLTYINLKPPTLHRLIPHSLPSGERAENGESNPLYLGLGMLCVCTLAAIGGIQPRLKSIGYKSFPSATFAEF